MFAANTPSDLQSLQNDPPRARQDIEFGQLFTAACDRQEFRKRIHRPYTRGELIMIRQVKGNRAYVATAGGVASCRRGVGRTATSSRPGLRPVYSVNAAETRIGRLRAEEQVSPLVRIPVIIVAAQNQRESKTDQTGSVFKATYTFSKSMTIPERARRVAFDAGVIIKSLRKNPRGTPRKDKGRLHC